MNKIIPFDYNGHQVRSLMIKGEPWFVTKDACEVLEISNHNDAISRLDIDEKGVASIDTLGGPQDMSVINEPGLYNLTLGSKKPQAKPFQRWVTHDVLPTLRKTGTYSVQKDFPTKSTSAGEVASLTKENRRVMKDQGSSPQKIANQTEKFYKQFGIDVIDNFVEPESAKWPAYDQVTLEETVTERTTSVKQSFPIVRE